MGGREAWRAMTAGYVDATHYDTSLREPHRNQIWNDFQQPRFRIHATSPEIDSLIVIDGARGWRRRAGQVTRSHRRRTEHAAALVGEQRLPHAAPARGGRRVDRGAADRRQSDRHIPQRRHAPELDPAEPARRADCVRGMGLRDFRRLGTARDRRRHQACALARQSRRDLARRVEPAETPGTCRTHGLVRQTGRDTLEQRGECNYSRGSSRTALVTNPAMAAPITGAIQNSQSC